MNAEITGESPHGDGGQFEGVPQTWGATVRYQQLLTTCEGGSAESPPTSATPAERMSGAGDAGRESHRILR